MNIMRPTRFAIISLALSLCLIFGLGQVRAVQGEFSDAPSVIGPLYKFTSKLFSTLNNGSLDESNNIVVSPISIHKALNMVLLGTDAGTDTERELLNTIGYEGLSGAEIQKCHEDYARLLAKFKQLTADASEQQQDQSARGYGNWRWAANYRNPKPNYSPMLDLFNMMITRNKARVLPEYERKVKRFYESTMENVDDKKPATKRKVMDQLDGWAKGAGFDSPIMTQKELDSDFEAILLSAIRVQVAWATEFHQSKDAAIFYNQGLRSTPVKRLALRGVRLEGARYLELTDVSRCQFEERAERLRNNSASFDRLSDLNAQIVRVPMKGGLTYTMCEPLEHSTPGDNKLNKLVAQLFSKSTNSTGETKLTEALQLLESKHGAAHKMDLTMPKFKFEKELNLIGTLMSMGLNRAFKSKTAQISHMISGRLCISKAKHQAMIDVKEKGIEAAAMTQLIMAPGASMHPPERLSVSVTKPFVFMIHYDKIPLFVGQLSSL